MTSWPCTQKISPRLRSKFDLRRDAHEQSFQPQPFDFPFEERQLVLQCFTGYRDGIRLRPLHFVRLYQQCISFELVKLILGFVVSPCLGPWKQFMVTIDDVWLYSPGSYATVAGNVLPWVRCVSWTSLARTGGGESCWVPSAALSIFVGFRWLFRVCISSEKATY